jgi:hypothetical protein
MTKLEELAKALESYVMTGRDGDAMDLAMFIDALITERVAEAVNAIPLTREQTRAKLGLLG